MMGTPSTINSSVRSLDAPGRLFLLSPWGLHTFREVNVSIYSRADWNARPAKKQIAVNPDLLEGVCIHWAGYKVSTKADTATTLRSIQKNHLDIRGWYDIAYQFAVDQAGDIWTLRGIDVENGAQGKRSWNRRYIAIVALCGPDQPVSDDMVEGLRAAVAHVRARWPQCREIIPHKALKPTQCPGPTLETMIANGKLEPTAAAPTPTARPQAPTTGPPSMPFGNGAKGDFVARLQTALGELKVDGRFGPQTERRLVKVQGCLPHLLGPADGLVRPNTWSWVEWTEAQG